MRVLITGGAGFIGSRLANQLHRHGNYVRVLDDLSSGDPSLLLEGINLNRGDVRDIPKLWSLLQGVDVVYHLAARVSVPASVLYPREYNDVNVGGTVSVLEATRDVGNVSRVVLASSATVYGDHRVQPISEDRDIRPAVPYAVSKAAAEQYLFTLGRLGGFQAVALRIFNTYGPGQDVPPAHAPVIPQFLRQIAGGGSVVVNGNGSQTRDFVYVDDVVDALISAGTAPDVDGEIINVGSGEEIAIRDLVALISKILSEEANVLYNSEASGGIARLTANVSKAGELLHYRPKVQLERGLRKLLDEDPNLRRVAAGIHRSGRPGDAQSKTRNEIA